MGKFKVGDKVRLKAGILPGKDYNGIELDSETITNILEFPYVTVKKIDNKDNTILTSDPRADWWIGQDALELYQEQPHTYKIGDIVRIKKREGADYDYPFYFSNYMSSLAGSVCQIVGINSTKRVSGSDVICKYFNGDYSSYELVPLDSSDERNFNYDWHSSMFEPVDELIRHIDTTILKSTVISSTAYKVGDKVFCCGYNGKIKNHDGDGDYYIEFTDHESTCINIALKISNYSDLEELCENSDYGTHNGIFPEFDTIENLMKFVDYLNSQYDKTLLTIKESETYEIRFQKPKASSKRGVVPTGSTIRGRKDKIAIGIGHLSYQVCNC